MSDKKIKVLFLDDDEFILDMYCMKLSNAGFEVHPFSSAQEALNALKEGLKVDVMLVDIIMPQMDGLEFLQEVQSQNLAGDAKIIMLTNQSEPEHMQKAKELGAIRYIVKANTIPSEVVEIVKQVINS